MMHGDKQVLVRKSLVTNDGVPAEVGGVEGRHER